MGQATKQGLLDKRLTHLNNFRRVMADIRINLHAASQNVTIIFNRKDYDFYDDVSHGEEEHRQDKKVLVTKTNVYFYTQALFPDFLIEPEDDQPWIVTLTVTDLFRPVTADDQFLISDELYTVSRVRLYNRSQDTVQYCLIYNEKGNIEQYQVDNKRDDDYYSYLNENNSEPTVTPSEGFIEENDLTP